MPDALGSLNTRVATTAQELQQVYRLRYQVYIEEQEKPYPEACHRRALLHDALDASAVVIGAFLGAQCVGTLRCNRYDCPVTFAAYSTRVRKVLPAVHRERLVVVSRLAITPAWRGSLAVVRALFGCVYRHALQTGIHKAYVDCRPPVVALMRRFGFVEVGSPYMHPLLGPLHQFTLPLTDIEHLKTARSSVFLEQYIEHVRGERAWTRAQAARRPRLSRGAPGVNPA